MFFFFVFLLINAISVQNDAVFLGYIYRDRLNITFTAIYTLLSLLH